VPLAFAHDAQTAVELAGEMSRTTHDAPEPVDVCRHYSGLIVGALRGEPKEILLGPRFAPVPGLWDEQPLAPKIDAIAAGSFKHKAPPAIRGTGYVKEACDGWYSGAFLMETVPTVLYILMRHGDDPEEAIVRAVNDTKDNDTVGAIVGAAVGATHGVDALPLRWRDGLLGRTGAADDGRIFELVALAQQRWLAGDDTAG
jgi:ADP-ribosylglycohydrolase